MKRSLLILATLLALSTPAAAAVKTEYVGLKEFKDFSILRGRPERAKAAFDRELSRHLRLKKHVGKDRTLELTFTDIDLAGAYEPWRNVRNPDIRYVRSIYPPRLSFSYVLKDAQGETIAFGKETISDVGFDFRARDFRTNERFYFELGMLADWARKKLPKE